MRAASSEETAASNPFWARIRCRARAAHGGRRAAKWWQFHGRSARCIGCAAVMPPAERVGSHRPEELRHQMLRPANVVSECPAMDTRLMGVEVLEPQLRLVGYPHVCSLRGICLRLGRRVAFALQRHWRHVVHRWQQWHSRLPPMRRIESDIRWQRPVHDGRLHRVTPLHGDAGCSSASSFWAKWELQSHTRGVFHSLLPSCCGRVDQFAARGSRTSTAPDAWLRAHQNVGSHDFWPLCPWSKS